MALLIRPSREVYFGLPSLARGLTVWDTRYQAHSKLIMITTSVIRTNLRISSLNLHFMGFPSLNLQLASFFAIVVGSSQANVMSRLQRKSG